MTYKLAFFGSPHNAADLLSKLTRDHRFKIVGVVTQPDRPVGRTRKLLKTPVAQYAEQKNIPILKPERNPKEKHLLKNPTKLLAFIRKVNPDLLLTYEFGQLIPPTVINTVPYGGLNIHFSLLPSYRGAAPLPWQIVNNETQTGISVVKISPEFDKGAIIYQEAHPIQFNDTTQSLHSRLSSRILKIIPTILTKYIAGEQVAPPINLRPRRGRHASLAMRAGTPALNRAEGFGSGLNREPAYYPRLTREHGFIPWRDFLAAINGESSKLAQTIERKIRAFTPWPGVWTIAKLKVKNEKSSPKANPHLAEKLKKKNHIVAKRLKILLATIDAGKLLPLEVQLEGAKPISWEDFCQIYSSVGKSILTK